VRLLAWNVHHALGLDLRLMPRRIVEVVRAIDPDVAALQELDVGRFRSLRLDQPAWIAAQLGMRFVFAETMRGYGHALFTRLPLVSATVVPLAHTPLTEPRSAIDAVVRDGETSLRVLATHLGLSVTDRAMQAGEIVARVLPSPDPVVVLGDLNAGPGEVGYEELTAASLRDPLRELPVRARCTWPALFAFRPLDHVLLSPALTARRVAVLTSGAARFASDHRPVVADVEIPAVRPRRA
jgi:endonuclease/exonuclease/phosphatase family metal-dependent hydrolase